MKTINTYLFLAFLILSSSKGFSQLRVGDPGVTFYEDKFDDTNYPEMREWAKAGVVGGIPFLSTSPIKKTIDATDSNGINAAITDVARQGGGQLVLNNGNYTIDSRINMKSKVRVVGESQSGVVLNITMQGTSGEAIRFGVQNAGIENMTIQGIYGTPSMRMSDQKPNYLINAVYMGGGTKNCWLDKVKIINVGNCPFTSWNSNHITIRDCHFEGSWNKGSGGHGYFQIAGSYTLIYNTFVTRLRHITIQRQYCHHNVFYQNNVEQDFNFHDSNAGYNLVEQNISRLNPELNTQYHSMMGPWSIQHQDPPGTDAIYRNDCIERNNNDNVTFSDPNLVYIPVRHENSIPFDTHSVLPKGGTFYPVNLTTLSTNTFDTHNITAFPNPAQNYISLKGLKGHTNYKIFDIIGTEMGSGNITNNEKINLQNLSVGLYLIKLENENVIKFLKQ